MIALLKYNDKYKQKTVIRIAEFFGFHVGLINDVYELSQENFSQAEQTLCEWLLDKHELFVIEHKGLDVGFVHIGYRGDNVAWIEDIFVDKNFRGNGIATSAIYLAEDRIKLNPKYTAVCIDVVPRNTAAMRLYHKLGYDSLSILTVRKEFSENNRDRKETVFELEYRY